VADLARGRGGMTGNSLPFPSKSSGPAEPRPGNAKVVICSLVTLCRKYIVFKAVVACCLSGPDSNLYWLLKQEDS